MIDRLNPLMSIDAGNRLGAIPFDKIKTEHYLPAFEVALSSAQAKLDAIKSCRKKATFENTFLAIEEAEEHLRYICRICYSLQSAESNAAYKAMVRQISLFQTEYDSKKSTDPKLFARIKTVYDLYVAGKPEPKFPTNLADQEYLKQAERYRIIKNTYNDFIRNGAMLKEADKAELTAIDMELTKLRQQFRDNIQKATNAFELYLTDQQDISGIPETTLSIAALTAEQKGKTSGWMFSLQPSSLIPVMTYCNNRNIRKKAHKARLAQAYKGKFDNCGLIKQILQLRYNRARLLGFKNHVDYVLKERMAGSSKTVIDFLDKIYQVAYPIARQEIAEVKVFAQQLDGLKRLMPWDYGYYANKLKGQRYDYDPEVLRPWLKIEHVLDGLFIIANRIYGLHFNQVHDIPVYHKDVQTWEVYDHGRFMGLLYLDLFPRDTKYSGAWMALFQGQGIFSDGLRRPHVLICASLTPSTKDQPSLLRLDEVRTIFHEFGHALHALLSDCYYQGVSGDKVMWDFVELPSMIMENWLFEKEALNLFAKHYQTGALLPDDLLDKVVAANNFEPGGTKISQVRFSSLDLNWYSVNPAQIDEISAFEKRALAPYKLLPQVSGICFSCSFYYIFAGAYSAGYYSYLWAEALEADVWREFAEKGIFDPVVANSFRQNVLAHGNTFHPMQLFIAFKGRKPDTDALLKRVGLI